MKTHESSRRQVLHYNPAALVSLLVAAALLSACADTNMSGPAGAGTSGSARSGGPSTASDTTGSTTGQPGGMNDPQH